MKVKTSELQNEALAWAVAKCQGRALREPVTATHDDVKGVPTPFSLHEVVCTYAGGVCTSAVVKPIQVTRCGVDADVGATAPSITFVDSDGRQGRGSIEMFFLKPQEAELAAQASMVGSTDGFDPATNWVQGGPIIEREGISMLHLFVTDDPFRWAATAKPTIKDVKPESVYGPTYLIAAMRCYVASKLGNEIDVPEGLVTNKNLAPNSANVTKTRPKLR